MPAVHDRKLEAAEISVLVLEGPLFHEDTKRRELVLAS